MPEDDAYTRAAMQIQALVGEGLGALRVWGDWFGRPHDNVHVLSLSRGFGDGLVLRFLEGETLTVWEPRGLVIDPSRPLLAMRTRPSVTVSTARRVRWEWYLYGRPRTADNLRFRDYRIVGSDVVCETDEQPDMVRRPDIAEPAVQFT